MFIAYLAATADPPIPRATAIDPASWFSPDDYPMDAMKQGIEGSVTFEVDVDAAGQPGACRIVVSSGSPTLDQRTCDIVRSRGRFVPATGPGGTSVAGRYRNRAIWKMPDMLQPAYHATILDFSADPADPVCTVQSKGPAIGGPTCDQLTRQDATKAVQGRVVKVVYLISQAPAGEAPYRGEADWGPRLSYLAADTYYLKGSLPTSCIPVATEGVWAGMNACSSFPGTRTLTDAEKSKAIRMRTEVSFFAILRPVSSGGACKQGESAAEAAACN